MICIIQREEQIMKIVDKRLRETADVINKKFAKVNEENRSEVSADVLPHLRNSAKRLCIRFMTRKKT